MIDGIPVIDAVVHPYDLSEANVAGEVGAGVREAFYGLHSHWNPPDRQLPRERFLADHDVETLAATLFLETPTDLAVCHTLRLDSLFRDGLCGRAKNAELQRRWPQRFIAYVGLDPTLGVERSLAELDEQLDELPQAVGVKLYPDQVDPYRTYRMDDPTVCFPIYERAQERGIKVIAQHKALPNGPVPLGPYRIDDLEGAAMAFPDLAFEIVHAGMAFVDETAYALARFPNVYANLEVTSLLLDKAPRLFQEALATFLFWGGPDKVLWGTGCGFGHPAWMLERFMALQWDEDLADRYGLPPLDRDIKARILGANYASMVGLDLPTALEAAGRDEWAARQAKADGLLPAFTAWTARR